MVGCALFGDLFESHMTRGPKLAAAWCYLLLAAAVQRSAHAQRTNIDRGPETNELPPGLVSLVTPAKPDRGEFEMSFHILQTINFPLNPQNLVFQHLDISWNSIKNTKKGFLYN